MELLIGFLNSKIDALWAKHPKDAMEAHVRAEEITRLEKLRDSKRSEAKLKSVEELETLE